MVISQDKQTELKSKIKGRLWVMFEYPLATLLSVTYITFSVVGYFHANNIIEAMGLKVVNYIEPSDLFLLALQVPSLNTLTFINALVIALVMSSLKVYLERGSIASFITNYWKLTLAFSLIGMVVTYLLHTLNSSSHLIWIMNPLSTTLPRAQIMNYDHMTTSIIMGLICSVAVCCYPHRILTEFNPNYKPHHIFMIRIQASLCLLTILMVIGITNYAVDEEVRAQKSKYILNTIEQKYPTVRLTLNPIRPNKNFNWTESNCTKLIFTSSNYVFLGDIHTKHYRVINRQNIIQMDMLTANKSYMGVCDEHGLLIKHEDTNET
nr:hypothetical protein [Vibrio cyclitrophicus]PMJ54419.1 hypothetical protein BCU19_17560 [Vibrio cyclitrophicus]